MQVPWRWRGGRISTLFKKGDSTIRDNFRGLLIADHMSKAFTSILDDYINPAYLSSISSVQCGGVPEKGTDIASHIVRSCIDIAKLRNTPIAILYIDLEKAFDKIVREIALGWPSYPYGSKTELLVLLGIPAEEAGRIIQLIDVDGPLLSQAGVHPHAVSLMNFFMPILGLSVVKTTDI